MVLNELCKAKQYINKVGNLAMTKCSTEITRYASTNYPDMVIFA